MSVIPLLSRSSSRYVCSRRALHFLSHSLNKGQIGKISAIEKREFDNNGENKHTFREDKDWHDRVESGEGLLLALNSLHQEKKEKFLILISFYAWYSSNQIRTTFLLCFSLIKTRLLIFSTEASSLILRLFPFKSSITSSSLSSLWVYAAESVFLLRFEWA